MNRKIWISLVGFIATLGSIAQPAIELKKYQDKYPGEHVVTLHDDKSYDISINKEGELDVVRVVTEDRLYLNSKSASMYSSEKISYSHFYKLGEINAYTEVPGEKKYSKVKVTDFVTKDELSGSIFYDDSKSKSFFFPSLAEGSKSHLDYETTITEPRFMTGFYFGSFSPLESSVCVITADNDIELIFKYFNTTADSLNFTKEVGKKRTTYRWSVTESKKFKLEDNTPPAQSYIPHVIPRIKSYSFNGEEIKILGDLTDLHNWYYDLIDDINKEPSEDLIQVTDSLVDGLTTDKEKVKAIYYWVQDNIKYIAMEAGLGGFIPEEASEVCKNKYGDCKGMSSITNQMLTIAGIESHLTWIGSRDLIYKYNDIPTPVVDNHMICTYIDGDDFYFLDATGSEVPLSLSTSFIQGKEALIDMGGGKYQVHEVPIVDRLTNLELDTTTFTIDETGKVIGKTNYVSNGLNSIYMRRSLKGRTHDELKKYVSSYNAKGNNKFIVDTFQVSNIMDKDLPINISLEYTIQDYVTLNEDEMYVNLHLDRYFVDGKIDDDRENAFESSFKSTSRNIVYLDVPDGYAINYIPDNDSMQGKLFGYDIKYSKVNDKQVKLEFEVYEDYLILTPEYFEEWNKMIKGLKNNYSETVILKKI